MKDVYIYKGTREGCIIYIYMYKMAHFKITRSTRNPRRSTIAWKCLHNLPTDTKWSLRLWSLITLGLEREGRGRESTNNQDQSPWTKLAPDILADIFARADGYELGSFVTTRNSSSSIEPRAVPWIEAHVPATAAGRQVYNDWLQGLPLRLSNAQDGVVECRFSPVHGKGVFATTSITRGQFIVWYDGTVHLAKSMKRIRFARMPQSVVDNPMHVKMTVMKLNGMKSGIDVSLVHGKADGDCCVHYLNHACSRHANWYLVEYSEKDNCLQHSDNVEIHNKKDFNSKVWSQAKDIARRRGVWCAAQITIKAGSELFMCYNDSCNLKCPFCTL